jgi:ABC-type transporter Mla MlaB component
MLGPPRTAGAARATKSNGTKGSDLGNRKAASPKPVPGEPARDGPVAPVSLTTLTLAAECMVSDAASLKERLAVLIGEPRPVTLDITALQRIDTAGLQLIVAFVRDRAGQGRTVEWQGSAPVLATAAQLLGLTSLLQLPA